MAACLQYTPPFIIYSPALFSVAMMVSVMVFLVFMVFFVMFLRLVVVVMAVEIIFILMFDPSMCAYCAA